LPPPVHGVSLMNSYIVNSKSINASFSLDYVDLKFTSSTNELQKFSFLKIFKAICRGYEIVKKILTYKPDLVYFTICPTGFAFYRDAVYVAILKLFEPEIVFHLHGKGIKNNAEKSSLKKNIYTWVFNKTNVICLSEHLSGDISGVYHSVPFIVPNGIEVRPRLIVNVNRINGAVPRILYLSNFKRNKGILVLIEALSILRKQGYLFDSRLIGAPSDLTIEFLENVIINQKLTDVTKIVGPLYGNDKFLEFEDADIFVFPTYNDAFPLVIQEAMQYSLPVISTFEGSIPDMVVDNETGFLVEAQNAGMLAEKIAILLKDENLRIRMGMRGHDRFINNYTLNHFENNMIKTFNTILDRNQRTY
jgi:glycosyltransferase involved in cell wall biosynthesis